MGVDLLLCTLSTPAARTLDWEAAAAWITGLEPSVVLATGDELFPWEGWFHDADVDDMYSATGAFVSIREGRRLLRRSAGLVRAALEDVQPDQLLEIRMPDRTYYVTGGESVGDPPGDLLDHFIFFGDGGVAKACGFDYWTQYAAIPLDGRDAVVPENARRLVKAGSLFSDLVDAAAERIATYQQGEPEDWEVRIERTLATAQARGVGGSDGGALWELLVEAMALMLALYRAQPPEEAEDLEFEGEDWLRTLDEVESPAVESEGPVLAELVEAGTVPLLPALAGRGDARAAEDLTAATGSSLTRSLAIEINSYLLAPGVMAYVDVYGDRPGLSGSRKAPPPIEPDRTPLWSGLPSTYAEYISWCLTSSWDWESATSAVADAPSELHDQLRDDLAEIREVIEGDRYVRLATEDSIAGRRLWMTAGPGDSRHWSGTKALRRLGTHGVLAAAGVDAWG